MQTDTPDPTAALSGPSTDVADVIKGYAEMEKRASPELRPVVQRPSPCIRPMPQICGTRSTPWVEPHYSGSIIGAVHVAGATAQARFDKLDETAVPQIIKGEERHVGSCSKAIEAAHGVDHLRDMLIDQSTAVQLQIDALQPV